MVTVFEVNALPNWDVITYTPGIKLIFNEAIPALSVFLVYNTPLMLKFTA